MSILYYSNFCEHSKKLLQNISKTTLIDEIHFICIDKRTKEKDGKIYIILENGQKLIMPENVDRVPALLLLNNFNVLYGEDIYDFMKPAQKQMVSQATMNNMEPVAYCLGGSSYGGIVSDNFSFLDMDAESLKAKGDGGMRQLHNYVSLSNDEQVNIYTPSEDNAPKSQKIQEGLTIEQLQQQRDQDIASMKNIPRQFI